MDQAFNSKDIVTALDRVLKSRTFERSERGRDLLMYLVSQDLDGNAGAIKGFSIAVDVFGKDSSFDPATDPLVRVHAGRLRELLSSYYADEGKEEAIIISIPTGRYVPEYSKGLVRVVSGEDVITNSVLSVDRRREIPEDSHSVNAPKTKFGLSIQKVVLIALALLFVGLAGLVIANNPLRLWDRITVDRQDAIQDAQASASQLPVLQVITNVRDPDLMGFADRLNSGLSAFDTVTVLQTRPLSVLERKRGQWSNLDYSLNLSKTGQSDNDGNLVVLVELVALAEEKVLRAEEYPIDIWDRTGNQRLIAQKLTSMAAPEGAIYADIFAKGKNNPVMDCLSDVRTYYGLSNNENHQHAYECTKALSEQESVSGLILSIYGGLIAEAAGKSYAYPDLPDEPEEVMRLALNTALKGIDLSPLSARAAREVGFVYSWQGAFSAMSGWFERANELNPNDTSVAASYGYGLVLSGEYAKAIPIFKDAVSASARHPSWWDFYFALALLMEERFDEASEAIIPMGLSNRSLLYSMLNAVLAFKKGHRHRSTFLVRLLREKYPKFAANPEGSFEKRHFPKDLIDNLVQALEKSGLSTSQ